MTADVTVTTAEPTPTAVVTAATTWAEFPVRDWSQANGYRLAGPHWEIYGDPGPSGDFDVQVLWSVAAPSNR